MRGVWGLAGIWWLKVLGFIFLQYIPPSSLPPPPKKENSTTHNGIFSLPQVVSEYSFPAALKLLQRKPRLLVLLLNPCKA